MDLGGYKQRSAEQGDVDIVLSCNMIQSSDVEWTLNSTSGYFIYIYVNGTITDFRNFLKRFSLVNDSSLRMYLPEPQDTGLYNCYEANGRRVVGYNLTVTGVLLTDYLHDLPPSGKTAGIKFTQRPKISIFAPQGRLVAPIHLKFIAWPRGTWVCLVARNSTSIGSRWWERGPKISKISTFW